MVVRYTGQIVWYFEFLFAIMLSLYPSATQKARPTRRYAPCKPNPRPAPTLPGKTAAFRAALPYTLPICVGFLFLGMSYGFLMRSQGFSVWYPLFMSMFIFAGSMEFVTANLLLLPTFQPLHAFLLTLMVNARHLFYGLSMLDKFKNLGWKKPYLIFGLCDETFSIHCAVTPPAGIDRGWFMFFVTILNQIYWVAGATLGSLLGYLIQFNTTGIEFVMTALFVVMFLTQWEENKDHRPALIGVGCTALCLVVLGSDHFLLPAMGLIILAFLALRKTFPQEVPQT